MKTIIAAVAGLAMASTAFAGNGNNQWGSGPKQIEISLGGVLFTGDLDTAGFDGGFLAGLDYYLNTGNMAMGPNTKVFVGARGWFAEDAGINVNTWGAHVGLRFGMNANPNSTSMNNLYFKLAVGAYNTDIEGVGDEWGAGGFAGVGWEFQGNAAIEIGYQIAPEVTGINNTSWYGAITFKV